MITLGVVHKLLALAALALASCADDGEIPTCAELGCELEPSGSAEIWTPCDPGAAVCYCLVPAIACNVPKSMENP